MEADYVPIFKDKAQYKTLDPNNKFWAEDKNRFGYKMLQNMGWQDGEGLGSSGDGIKEHVKINKKISNSGIGEASNSSDNWLKGAFEYGNLLKKLNQTIPTSTISEQSTKIESSSKQRHLYQKRLASRDASGYSKEDMDLILGSQKVKQLAEESSDSEVAYESDQDDGLILKTSTVSVYDYFQKKGQLVEEVKPANAPIALLAKRSSPDDSDDAPIEPPTKKQKTEKEVSTESVKEEKKSKKKKEKSAKGEKKSSEKKKESKKELSPKKAKKSDNSKKEKKAKAKAKKLRKKEKREKKKQSSKSSKPNER